MRLERSYAILFHLNKQIVEGDGKLRGGEDFNFGVKESRWRLRIINRAVLRWLSSDRDKWIEHEPAHETKH